MHTISSLSSTEPQKEDPGAYPIPFDAPGVESGSRLDSISSSLRYWAVNPKRAHARWYKDMVEAHLRYEEWLRTRPPGEYPMPFGDELEGKRLDEVPDGRRHWGVHPDRSSCSWYTNFVKANTRYEEHLAATREPGNFPFPPGNIKNYTGKPIKDLRQDGIWWALRPANKGRGWYQPMYDANKRLLDDVYKSRSPGSELIWFGPYRGLRLDQVYQRKGFMRWCFDPRRNPSGWIYRLEDLIARLEEWRRMHPERGGPRQRRKAPDIQNPVGEAIGCWDDSPGSAGEEDYENDSFVQSDSEELDYASESNKSMDDNAAGDSGDFSEPASSDAEMNTSPRRQHKRRRPNVILSDEESEPDVGGVRVRKLGKRYRVQDKSSEE